MFQKPREIGAFGNVGQSARIPLRGDASSPLPPLDPVSGGANGVMGVYRETTLVPRDGTPRKHSWVKGNAPTGRDGERIRCQGVFRPTPPKVPSDGTPNSSVRCAGAPGERSHGSWNSPWRQAQAHGAPGVECVSRRSARLDASASGGRSCPGLVAGANGVMGAYRESTLAPRWKVSKEQGGSRETPLRDVGRRNSPARACSSAGPGELGAERPQWEVQPGSGERRPSPPHAVMCNVTLAPRPRREGCEGDAAHRMCGRDPLSSRLSESR